MTNKNIQLDESILKELNRYKSIGKYITEQDALGAPPSDAPPTVDPLAAPADPLATDAAPADPLATDTGMDPMNQEPVSDTDPDVEKISDEGEPETTDDSSTEELDITELVTSQKNVEQKQDEFFKNLMAQVDNMQTKLSEMDSIVGKLNDIEIKIEKYRQKTPQEKLELRSLDSGPYNTKLSDFFIDKEVDMQKSGKNEYVLTSDDVTNFSENDIKDSFNPSSDKNI